MHGYFLLFWKFCIFELQRTFKGRRAVRKFISRLAYFKVLLILPLYELLSWQQSFGSLHFKYSEGNRILPFIPGVLRVVCKLRNDGIRVANERGGEGLLRKTRTEVVGKGGCIKWTWQVFRLVLDKLMKALTRITLYNFSE